MDLDQRFAQGLVLDGGLATQLERHGADLGDDLWSARLLADDPDLIRRVHLEYFRAGADVAVTASYQASFEGFARRGVSRGGAADLMRRSVVVAREAAAGYAAGVEAAQAVDGPLVAASVGPYGAMLADGSEYDGRYGVDVATLADFHRPRIEVLLDAGPDLLAVETIPSGPETEALVTVLTEHPEARAWVSFSCRDEVRLHDGTPLRDAAALAASCPEVVAVGVNCTPPGFVGALLRSADGVGLPMLAYPNLGSTWDATAKRWVAEGARPDFGALASVWRGAGAASIGGCCGTRPEDIEAIAAALHT